MSARRARLLRVIAGVVLATGGLASCAGTQDEPATSVAGQFLAHVEQGEGLEACAVLAPAARDALEQQAGKPCETAVLEEDPGPPVRHVSVQVYDSMAQVRFPTGPVFLSQFDGDWLVVAAACTPRPDDQPYDCSIQVS